MAARLVLAGAGGSGGSRALGPLHMVSPHGLGFLVAGGLGSKEVLGDPGRGCVASYDFALKVT